MALNESTPFRKPGHELTCLATANVTGKRFVAISGNPALIGDNARVAHAAAGTRTYGVSVHDFASGTHGAVHTGQGLEVPVTADGAVPFNSPITPGTAGKAKVATGTDVVVAIAVTTAADGADVRVKIL